MAYDFVNERLSCATDKKRNLEARINPRSEAKGRAQCENGGMRSDAESYNLKERSDKGS